MRHILKYLEERRYWTFYYVVFLVMIGFLSVVTHPRIDDLTAWASILTVSAGVALVLAAIIEMGVRIAIMLLIQPYLKQVRKEGRDEGVEEGIRRGKLEALPLLISLIGISPDDNRWAEVIEPLLREALGSE